MARKRISEYKAKLLLFEALSLPYQGIQVTTSDLSFSTTLDKTKTYVVKVDQGVKKRFKQGLIHLDIQSEMILDAIEDLRNKGYTQFLIEPYYKHKAEDERYFALERIREGIAVYVSKKGGVGIEEQQNFVKQFIIPQDTYQGVAKYIEIDAKLVEEITKVMDKFHISFLEINPLVVKGNNLLFLDLAVEVDSAGSFFVKDAWNEQDIIDYSVQHTVEEAVVEELSTRSQASFKLVLLNPNGSIFMLLSGGGASIVLADEVYNQGFGKELANYGEYSGNPNAEETYIYTKQLLSLLLKSKARKKILIIAGGVANFTDIRITFRGIIQALAEVKGELQKQNVKIYVRRGGPYQEEGLAMMKSFLEKAKLVGDVSGPEMVLTDIVREALQSLKSE
jgi:ATP-citrate lyase beta-subunit